MEDVEREDWKSKERASRESVLLRRCFGGFGVGSSIRLRLLRTGSGEEEKQSGFGISIFTSSFFTFSIEIRNRITQNDVDP